MFAPESSVVCARTDAFLDDRVQSTRRVFVLAEAEPNDVLVPDIVSGCVDSEFVDAEPETITAWGFAIRVRRC